MREQYPPERRPARIVAELQVRADAARVPPKRAAAAEVMVDFWFTHFNVFAAKGEVRWYLTATSAT